MKNDYTIYWDNICQIYLLTKRYLLLGEELSEEFNTIVQPLKEHRDALDHIVRAYGVQFLKDVPQDVAAYQMSNMKKAVGHVYRAFFDTADFITYVCRKKIREVLGGKQREEICAIYPNYPEARQFFNRVPEQIAKIRENKDVSSNANELVPEVKAYQEIIEKMLGYYREIRDRFN